MKILYHRNFVKNYKKRIASNSKLVSKFKLQLEILLENPSNSVLKNHRLIGQMVEYRSFSVTGDIRVIYRLKGKNILLYDIGSHNQVY